ncbi:MAG TPA: SpoIIE family protein phosphatase [Thermoanaerobaculia bacterium]|nr:SpoIIE family protein phosphatase [Thermoanaerobaculia bacterium]
MKPETKKRAAVAFGLFLFAIVLAAVANAGIPYASSTAKAILAALLVLILGWIAIRAYRAFLWKVGRRLAFSYFLVGVLPIPMVLVALSIGLYILSGFFLGHLFRDGTRKLTSELRQSAMIAFHEMAHDERQAASAGPEIVFGYYRDGKKFGGDPRAPLKWPDWLTKAGSPKPPTSERTREEPTTFVSRKNGAPTLAAAAGDAKRGVVALYVGDLEQELSERSDLWIELYRPEDVHQDDNLSIQAGGRTFNLQRLHEGPAQGEAAKFFKVRSKGERFWDTPFLIWGEAAGSLLDLETGARSAEYVAAKLRTTPRMIRLHYFSPSAEFDAAVWGGLVIVVFLLFDVYVVAALMASVLIFGISRAFNRLSRATVAVQEGNFAVRIPVKRRDQIGAMQRSFNAMAANLERLVASAAQKELLDKELAIARDLQKSLLPARLPTGRGVEFATLFEPSAAIGGDYYDILPFGGEDLAVMIADVSGHGLHTGLRMAMVKAGLQILVEEVENPAEIMRRLDRVVRGESGTRFFVTATLARIDLEKAEIELTNAGHPPTYHLRGGTVREIMLPGSPLGVMRQTYGAETIKLLPGDVVVWLSDGLIEASNAQDEPFGYDCVVRALSGPTDSAEQVRDRLLAAIETHTAGHPAEDDRTLVVFRYAPESAG